MTIIWLQMNFVLHIKCWVFQFMLKICLLLIIVIFVSLFSKNTLVASFCHDCLPSRVMKGPILPGVQHPWWSASVAQHLKGSGGRPSTQKTNPSYFQLHQWEPQKPQAQFPSSCRWISCNLDLISSTIFRKAEVMLFATVFKLIYKGFQAEAPSMGWSEKNMLGGDRGRKGWPSSHPRVLPQGLPSTQCRAALVWGAGGGLHPRSAWQMVTVFLSLLAGVLGFLPLHFKTPTLALVFSATCFLVCCPWNILESPLAWFGICYGSALFHQLLWLLKSP